MMEAVVAQYIVLCLSALAVSGLTLFSGFGLGTLLMPVFAIFFPMEIAVAMTAIVHLANNIFKLGLLWRQADLQVAMRFIIPGAIMAVIGAIILTKLSDLPVLASYAIGSRVFEIETIKLVVGGLIFLFALLELLPALEARIKFDRKHLPLGGALSGFFGGISGHQGALRSAVLIKCGLEKEAFIATGVVCAVIVDFSRLIVYGTVFFTRHFNLIIEAGGISLIGVVTLAAFVGAFAGKRLMKKVTLRAVQLIVGIGLLVLSTGLVTGLI
jgi:uncharacterized membrane protein YfcA